VVEPRLERELDRAHQLFRRLPELGVPIEKLIGELEAEGVAAFAKSYQALIDALEARRSGPTHAGARAPGPKAAPTV
jgi:hypothetical protein